MAALQPVEFISKWRAIDLSERAVAHSHFIDLCALLGEEAPTDADPSGERYCFEKGAVKTTGRPGWADVWKRERFAWEYKKKRRNLNDAFVQLQQYAVALENPPLLVVSDIDRIEVHTNWTNSVAKVYEFTLDDLRDAGKRDILKCVWADPEKLRPEKTRAQLTEEAAGEFAALAQRLRDRGHAPEAVAHFVNRLVFCMFAEDVGLLPPHMFKRMLDESRRKPDEFSLMGADLFRAMQTGGRVGFDHVDWFNGGLFDDDTVIPLRREDIELLQRTANLNWSEIDTSIFGTLFERGLDPDKRSQLGVHYTDRAKIQQIVDPVITRPLQAEWAQVKATLAALGGNLAPRRRGDQDQASLAAATYHAFLDRLRRFTVLDPACGSGNFLYVALLALKDIEHQVSIEAENLGFERELFSHVGPHAVRGIEINPYAAELARITVWIGEIQWMRRNGFNVSRNPILKPLDTIECRDAILDLDGTEANWPGADVVVGNPPFLGDKAMIRGLGEDYVTELRGAYAGRVPASADLVAFWFEKARALIADGKLQRAGLVATQAIRRGASRVVLDGIRAATRIFDAWSDEPWVVDGAAVRVSLVCFGESGDIPPVLNGSPVGEIYADLSSGKIDLTKASRLTENLGICFQGPVKVGPFDVSGEQARAWLHMPLNPNGRGNSEVVRPWLNGRDITNRPSFTWIVDFGELSEREAALFEAPFEYVRTHVKPLRDKNRDRQRRENWWRLGRSGADLKSAARSLKRVIVTPRVAKHRLFVWADRTVVPDSRVNVIARDDDMTFGILHSRFHEAWSLRLGGWHGVGNDPQYTPSMGFETFPFPDGLVPNRSPEFYGADARAEAIAVAARRLDELRSNWLNPPDADPEVPKERTLTNLYNERPTWLQNAHRDLDAAVAAAYGWHTDISDDDALGALFALNQNRSLAEQARTVIRPRSARELREQRELGLGVIVAETGGDNEPAAAEDERPDAAQTASS